jgi:hypothetical protein
LVLCGARDSHGFATRKFKVSWVRVNAGLIVQHRIGYSRLRTCQERKRNSLLNLFHYNFWNIRQYIGHSNINQ